MPNHKSAEKRDRQNERRRSVNGRNRSRMRTELKKLRIALDSNKGEAANLLPSVISTIDRSVQKGVIHKKAAARYKSRLTKKVNALTQ